MAGTEGAQQTQVKRYYGRNNAMAWQEFQLAHKPEVNEDNGWIKEEKTHTQAIPNPKKKRDAKNEDPMTHLRHKDLNKQQNMQQDKTNSQTMANLWTPNK